MKMNTTSARRANTARDPMVVDTALDLMNISSSSEEGFTVEQFSFSELEDRFRVGYSTAINYEKTFRKLLLRLILFEKLSGKRKIHPLPKMTYTPTLGILRSDRARLMLSMNDHDQQENAVEYEPTSQPELYRPHSPENFKNSGRTAAEQPSVNNEKPQMFGQNPSENKNHEPYQKLQKNQKIHKIPLPKILRKLPKKPKN